MKLVLSSCDFRNENSRKVIIDNLPYPIEKCKLLFIPNEKATSEAISSCVYHKRMQEFGFDREKVYIFDNNHSDDYRNLNIDVIYISGGNTFGTLDKIRKCGYDKDIINYVKSGVIYIGGSAGAHIASADIEHITNYDDNNVEMTDFRGLGLFNGVLVCHYTYMRKYDYDNLCKTSKYKAFYLTDNDSIVYEE